MSVTKQIFDMAANLRNSRPTVNFMQITMSEINYRRLCEEASDIGGDVGLVSRVQTSHGDVYVLIDPAAPANRMIIAALNDQGTMSCCQIKDTK